MTTGAQPGLLVSVRDPVEAARALAGGADLIDVKEPERGSLGRADDGTIQAVLDLVAGRRPVSSALGELADGRSPLRDPRLAYVKWGLAGQRSRDNWQAFLSEELRRPGPPQTVVVAYADWQCALAPPIDEVVAFACRHPGSALLIDTHCKEAGILTRDRKPTLLDWLPAPWLADICRRCREAGVRIALAGSLGLEEIDVLLPAGPDWFAVRGAACMEGQRRSEIDADRVRRLRARLRQSCDSRVPTQVAMRAESR